MVCAECKPRFVQGIRPGAATVTAVRYGGFWLRFVAVWIDSIILGTLLTPIQMMLGPVFGPSMAGENSHGASLAFAGLIWLVFSAVSVTYYTYFLSQKSATPGKMLLGLKVITADGGRISVARAIARYFAHLLSTLTLGIGYIMAAFDFQKRALHDHICSTRVIRQRS
jgi:uncharacterized RDD family membrane protein YckC